VLDHAGQAVAGLYAVGNDSASMMGGCYPSGGITLGPAMTFGYLAGLSIAGEARAAHVAQHASTPAALNTTNTIIQPQGHM
jgi:succinate dehydrogenase/fumarate reductase flavoprotein subunit